MTNTPAHPSPEGISLRYDVRPSDRDIVRRLVESTGHFTAAEVNVAIELVDDHLTRGPEFGYLFVFAEQSNETVGYACYGPIACTVGSFDLYWIAVDKSQQGRGIGQLLMREVERLVRQLGGRRIYIETSGRDQYGGSRGFYERCGYRPEARLQDFYAPGDDQVIYTRELSAPTSAVLEVISKGGTDIPVCPNEQAEMPVPPSFETAF